METLTLEIALNEISFSYYHSFSGPNVCLAQLLKPSFHMIVDDRYDRWDRCDRYDRWDRCDRYDRWG